MISACCDWGSQLWCECYHIHTSDICYADKWVNFSILKTQINSKKHPRDIVEEQQSEN